MTWSICKYDLIEDEIEQQVTTAVLCCLRIKISIFLHLSSNVGWTKVSRSVKLFFPCRDTISSRNEHCEIKFFIVIFITFHS